MNLTAWKRRLGTHISADTSYFFQHSDS